MQCRTDMDGMDVNPWRGAIVVAATAIALGTGYTFWHPEENSRTYRIGFEQSPPRQMVDAHGQPYGSGIDILREAARRAQVKLEWVFVLAGPDRGLSDGSVDPWPILNNLPERSRFHFSEPYAELNYWLLSKGVERVLDVDVVGGRGVGISAGLAGRIARAYLPKAQGV
jgi:ABC-type amino acid transport substrate-binding protein